MRNEATTSMPARATPAADQTRRPGLNAAIPPTAMARSPQPQNQSDAADAGDRELNKPNGKAERRKYIPPIPSPNKPQAMETIAHGFFGSVFVSPSAESWRCQFRPSTQPPPAPAINQRSRCSHGESPHHFRDPRSNKKRPGP